MLKPNGLGKRVLAYFDFWIWGKVALAKYQFWLYLSQVMSTMYVRAIKMHNLAFLHFDWRAGDLENLSWSWLIYLTLVTVI